MQPYISRGLLLALPVALAMTAHISAQNHDWQTKTYQTRDGKKTCEVIVYRGVNPYDWDNVSRVITTGKPVTEVTEACTDKISGLYTFAIDGRVHMFQYNGGKPVDIEKPENYKPQLDGIRGAIVEGSEQAEDINKRHRATLNNVKIR